ncbi:MAG: hypothetical protein R3200_15775 [Xanthomonadales bacterium]|nr:hypothetical protein [Xanthomonadales bacterium]
MKNDQRLSETPSGTRRLTGLYNLATSWLRANGHACEAGAEAPEDAQARHMHEVMTISGRSLELLAPMSSNPELQRAVCLVLDLGISVGRMAQLCDVADNLAEDALAGEAIDVRRRGKATGGSRASP